MTNLLFLDFDGVLHPNLCLATEYFRRVPELRECLLSLPIHVDIVVSSSWRFHHDLNELRAFFPDDMRGRIVATTGPAFIGKHSRYREIQAYLSKCRGAVKWCALDDSGWEFPENVQELLLCKGATGMMAAEVERLRTWFHMDKY
jgi:hypothetical protein